jgi:hypothetical protein
MGAEARRGERGAARDEADGGAAVTMDEIAVVACLGGAFDNCVPAAPLPGGTIGCE